MIYSGPTSGHRSPYHNINNPSHCFIIDLKIKVFKSKISIRFYSNQTSVEDLEISLRPKTWVLLGYQFFSIDLETADIFLDQDVGSWYSPPQIEF